MQDPLVSVVVPTKNSGSTLEVCLASIKNQSHGQVEIIVVDNHSSDNTRETALKYADKVLNWGPERSAQRNFGASQARGEFLLFPDSDMALTAEVVSSCVERIVARPEVRAVVIPEESVGDRYWARCRRLERLFYIGVDWMEAARFFERSTFEEMGGYDEENTGTEDFDLPQRIQAEYGSNAISRINELIYHDEQDVGLVGSCRKKFYYGQRLDRYRSVQPNVLNFRRQYSIFQRYKLFLKDPSRLIEEPLVSLGMLFLKLADFAAWGSGFLVAKLQDLKR